MDQKLPELISYIVAALSNCAQYSQDNPAVEHYSAKVAGMLDQLYEDGFFSIAVSDNNLLLNNEVIPPSTPHARKLFLKIRRKGVERILISQSVEPAVLKKFFVDLSATGNPALAYSGISLGFSGSRPAGGTFPVPQDVQEDNDDIMRVREIYQGISVFKTLDMGVLDAIMGDYIGYIRKEPDVMKILFRPYNNRESLLIHAANVAILSIFQAEHFGFRGEILHEIGIAAFLHDIGTLLIPKDIVEKKTPLIEEEWAEIKKHPVYGAMLLSTFPDIPELAIIAAFEHHMRYDSKGYPETKRRGKRKHFASQIIAIADFFDALISGLLYRKAFPVPVVAGLINEASGTELNPVLAKNFLNSLKKVSPSSFVV